MICPRGAACDDGFMNSNMTSPSAIAVIDDDESLCEALVGLIRSYGHAGRGFGSAELFLDSDMVESAACVVTDIHMTGMGGMALAQRLCERSAPIPVVMITARDDPGIEERARACGAICLLRKPFAAGALMACIEKA